MSEYGALFCAEFGSSFKGFEFDDHGIEFTDVK